MMLKIVLGLTTLGVIPIESKKKKQKKMILGKQEEEKMKKLNLGELRPLVSRAARVINLCVRTFSSAAMM